MISLYVSCDIDFAIHLIPAGAEDTIEQIVNLAASFVVDLRGRQPADTVPRLRRIEADTFLPPGATAGALGLAATDWLHLSFM
ncbi:MAG: hypothetical protein ACREXT_06395 [Gammaproteobacteria bacterium]